MLQLAELLLAVPPQPPALHRFFLVTTKLTAPWCPKTERPARSVGLVLKLYGADVVENHPRRLIPNGFYHSSTGGIDWLFFEILHQKSTYHRPEEEPKTVRAGEPLHEVPQ